MEAWTKAAVLPIAYGHVLMGRPMHSKRWCAFGDIALSKETPAMTASRAAFEQGRGQLGTLEQISGVLKRPDETVRVATQFTYFSTLDVDDDFQLLPLAFAAKPLTSESQHAISQVAWIPLAELHEAIAMATCTHTPVRLGNKKFQDETVAAIKQSAGYKLFLAANQQYPSGPINLERIKSISCCSRNPTDIKSDVIPLVVLKEPSRAFAVLKNGPSISDLELEDRSEQPQEVSAEEKWLVYQAVQKETKQKRLKRSFLGLLVRRGWISSSYMTTQIPTLSEEKNGVKPTQT